jgi:hypothetical protein
MVWPSLRTGSCCSSPPLGVYPPRCQSPPLARRDRPTRSGRGDLGRCRGPLDSILPARSPSGDHRLGRCAQTTETDTRGPRLPPALSSLRTSPRPLRYCCRCLAAPRPLSPHPPHPQCLRGPRTIPVLFLKRLLLRKSEPTASIDPTLTPPRLDLTAENLILNGIRPKITRVIRTIPGDYLPNW